jgi:CarD family transcriptional regulator
MSVYEIGDIVIYGGEGLCRIDSITEKKFDNKIISYYVLKNLLIEESVTYVPIDSGNGRSKMRAVLGKEEILELMKNIPEPTEDWIENPRERQRKFKDIIVYGDSKDLLNLMRTLQVHQEQQLDIGKKLHSADERIFKEAEKLIAEEIAYVFGIPKEESINLIMTEIA